MALSALSALYVREEAVTDDFTGSRRPEAHNPNVKHMKLSFSYFLYDDFTF